MTQHCYCPWCNLSLCEAMLFTAVVMFAIGHACHAIIRTSAIMPGAGKDNAGGVAVGLPLCSLQRSGSKECKRKSAEVLGGCRSTASAQPFTSALPRL